MQTVLGRPALEGAVTSKNLVFPASTFVGLGGDFVSLYSANLESPPEFLLASFYTCLGIAISPYVDLDLAFDSPPRLYTVLLGESGTPRKSTAAKLAIRFFEQIQPNPFRTLYGIGSVEGFAREFNGWRKLNDSDKRPTLLVYDELQAFVCKAGQSGSTLLPTLSTLFESDSYDNTTSKQRINLRGCNLAILSACTVDTYADMWTPEFTSIGFPNRLFVVKGDREKFISLPKPPTEARCRDAQKRIQELLLDIEQRARATGGKLRLKLSEDAEQRWGHFYSQMDRSIHAKRLDTYGFRWMVLLSLAQGEFEISRNTVERVIALLDYELAVRKLYDPIEAHNNVARMEEKIRRVLGNGTGEQYYSRRYIQQNTNANRAGLWFFHTALGNLLTSGEAERDPARKDHFRLVPVVTSVVKPLESPICFADKAKG